MPRQPGRFVSWTVVSVLAAVTMSLAGDEGVPVSPRHREWLEEVSLVITDEEQQTLLALERHCQSEGYGLSVEMVPPGLEARTVGRYYR